MEGGGELEKPKRSKINMQEMSAEMSAFMKGVDEADKGRLEVCFIFLNLIQFLETIGIFSHLFRAIS